ncbi:MAG: class I SAM-dependent methyltransferase [Candidatus Paceibacterota bacterium]|jgi:ubiquinone/menaquinone biosynthesis C-methylase UbiE
MNMHDHTAKNEKSYDTHAEEWESAMPINLAHKYMEKPAMTALLPQDLHGKSVLCIGTGSGEELDLLSRRGAEDITAIDISNELLKRAAAKFPAVKYHKMDMMNLFFADESFDFVYSSLAFHYASDWDKLLSEIYRVLKKGGVCFFQLTDQSFGRKRRKRGIYLPTNVALFL